MRKHTEKQRKAVEEVNEFFTPNIIGVAGLISFFNFIRKESRWTLHLYGDEVFSALIKHGVVLQVEAIESAVGFYRFTARNYSGYRVYFFIIRQKLRL